MSKPANPIFYNNVQALHPQQHGALSLAKSASYAFSRKTNSVPLVVEEFGLACRDYPILFTGTGTDVVPIAVLGVGSDHNAYIDKDGRWAENTYVPAYVRRYPFIFSEMDGSEDLTLCVQKDDDWLISGGDQALFDAQGEPTNLTRQALEFCTRYQQQFVITREFCEALVQADLLTAQNANVTLPNGQKSAMTGFQIVDENKVRQLSAKDLKKFNERGWLGLIHAHLIAGGSWSKVMSQMQINPPESA